MARTLPEPAHPGSLTALEDAEHRCERCDLHRIAHAVPGEGPRSARIMVVGEQPGDREDVQGRPFVGPAGRLLDELIADAGVDRDELFMTNAVKRFRHHEKVLGGGGVKRIHDKPTVRQVRACHVWLDSELELVDPEVVVLLGATAVQAVLGQDTRLRDVQGTVVRRPNLPAVVAASHPSAALRAPDHDSRARLREEIRAAFERAAAELD
jgi:DNA polymerase